jgi:DUF1680 family protein
MQPTAPAAFAACVARVCAVLVPLAAVAAQANTAAAGAASAGANLALVATPSGSYVSGDTSYAALNDGNAPANSRDRGPGSYGNWPKRGTSWVEYAWTQPIHTARIEVYWWDDHRGVRLPKACRLLWDDGKALQPVADGSGFGTAADTFNVTTFAEVTTPRLRLEIDGDGESSTGILEWRVLDSGRSPAFPPRVQAGLDRVVVLGGRTWLDGKVLALGGAATVLWQQAGGPGTTEFADAAQAATTATFHEAGDHELRLFATCGQLSASSTLRVRVIAPPPDDRLDVVYTRRWHVDSPLWRARLKSLITQWIPHCIEYCERTDLKEGEGGLDNFVEAAKALRGEPHGRHKGYVFSNAWVHQTVESMCLALMVDPDGDAEIERAQDLLRKKLDEWIPVILAAQEPDGYLQTAYTLADRKRWPARWNPPQRGNHEGYVAGYFLESAINHFTLTEGKDRRLYDAAKKLADCWVANLGPGKREWYDGHQEMEQALVRFGRFVDDQEGRGKGTAYIALARFLLDCRHGGQEYDQSHVPVVQQYAAVGHAVRESYQCSAMADIAAETHDLDYESAVQSLWDDLIERKYYVTGGIGSGETSEGFGRDYSLGHDAYCESCSSCGLIFFQYKLALAWHDAKYADLCEETLYNALLGACDLDGRTFNYTNPLVDGRRTAWHVCPCCVGNIPRTLLMLPTWCYSTSRDALYVNQFAGSTVRVPGVAGTDVEVVQQTDYPWSGKVAITVNPAVPKHFTVYVRVPDRRTSALYTATPAAGGLSSLAVDGVALPVVVARGYAAIERDWQRGDRIELELPLPVQLVRCDERVAANRGQVALRRGPLVYCVERVDGQTLDQALGKATVTATWRRDLLQGVVALQGEWADGKPLLAIPYFARLNRQGDGPRQRPMSMVWLQAPK